MAGTRIAARRAATRNKVLALGAAGVVLAGGVTVGSLAAWTDIEWIAGGAGSVDSIGASTFEVEQFALGDEDWGDYEDGDEPNRVDFSAQAAALTPGDTVYGFVQLRTAEKSLGGTLSLVSDTDVVDETLSAALTYGAVLVDGPDSCDTAGFAAGSTEGSQILAAGSALDADGAVSFSLDAATESAPGTAKTLCFAIHFPIGFAADDSLQGDTVSPVWYFDAISVAAP